MLMDLTKDDNDLLTIIMELEEEKTEQLNQITVLKETVKKIKADLAQANEDRDNEIAALQEEINRLEQECEQKQKTIDEIMSIMVEEKIDIDHDAKIQYFTDPSPEYACGYRFWRILYIVDNVKIRFYCGHRHYISDENWRPNYLEVTASSGYYDEWNNLKYYNNTQTVGKIENFESNKYKIEKSKLASVDEFLCYVDIKFPQELFADENGMICISMDSYVLNDDNEYKESPSSGFIFIYYKKVDSYIILSTERFV